MKKSLSRNTNIDAVRGIACLLVVLVHCPLPGMLGTYIISFARAAVPFFILVSGWFSYKGSDEQMLFSSRRKLKDTAKLALITAAAYTVWNSINCLLRGEPLLAWFTPFLRPMALVKLLAFNYAVFWNSIMYYLLMMIYVYIIFAWLVKKGWLQKAVFFILPALALNIALNGFLGFSWYYSGNFLLTGLPFFLLGNRLRHWTCHNKLQRKRLVAVFWVGLILTFVETMLLGSIYCYLGTILISVSVLLLCCESDRTVLPGMLSDFGREYSVYVFILHCGVRDTLNALTKDCDSLLYQCLLPFAAMAGSVLLGILCKTLRRKAGRA